MSDFPRSASLVSMVVASLIGIAAGMSGALLVAAYVLPPEVPDTGNVGTTRILPDPAEADANVERAALSAVRFYEGAGSQTPAGKVWPKSALLAGGVILTSDGWVVTERGVIPDRLLNAAATLSVVTEAGRALTVERVVDAPSLGLVFVKTSGRDVPVVGFANSGVLESGARIFTPTDTRGALQATTLHLAAGRDGDAGLAETSADFRRRLFLQDAARLTGMPVLTADGALAGMAVRVPKGETVPRAIPAEVLRAALSEVLTAGKVTFVDIGFSVLPFGAAVAPTQGEVRTGAVVTDVRKGTAAAAAGIQVGDVLLSVGSDSVTIGAPFAEWFVSYAHGSTMELLVLRNGTAVRIALTRP